MLASMRRIAYMVQACARQVWQGLIRTRYIYLPPLPFVLALVVSAFHEKLVDLSCSPARIVFIINDLHNGDSCASIPLTADLPGLVLGVTSTLATWLYLFTVRRWDAFPQTAAYKGIVTPFGRTTLVQQTKAQRSVRNIRLRPWGQVSLAIICGMCGYLFYQRTYTAGYLFSDFAARSTQSTVNGLTTDSFRNNWWASPNYAVSPVLWILIGSIGLFYAIRSVLLNVEITSSMKRLIRGHYLEVGSPARTRNGGWDELTVFYDHSYYGQILAAFSFTAVIYLVRDPFPFGVFNLTMVVLLACTILAMTLTTVRSNMKLRAAHAEAKGRQLQSLESVPAIRKFRSRRERQGETDTLIRLLWLQENFIFPKIGTWQILLRLAAIVIGSAGFLSAVSPVLNIQ